jgi:hypothetical protein
MKNNWWSDISDITEEDITQLVLLYNSMITQYSTNYNDNVKYYIKYKSKKFKESRHYGDALKLLRFIFKLNFKPREYLNVQFSYYKQQKKHPYCRPVPSLKNLSSPAALSRWKIWLVDTKKLEPPSVTLSEEELVQYEEGYLQDMIKAYKLPDETSLLKDIVLARSLPLTFLQTRATFLELVVNRYYENTYNVKDYKELFV